MLELIGIFSVVWFIRTYGKNFGKWLLSKYTFYSRYRAQRIDRYRRPTSVSYKSHKLLKWSVLVHGVNFFSALHGMPAQTT